MSGGGESAAPEALAVRKPGRSGFTLIELMAAVTILVLIAGLVLPRLGLRTSQAALEQGQEIAAVLELARESAVSSRRPRRVVLDLDSATYWVEAAEGSAASAAMPLAWSELDELPLVAPRDPAAEFEPLTGNLGRPTPLRNEVRFGGIETNRGPLVEGVVAIAFGGDGATEPARLWLVASDETQVALDVAPLADAIEVTFASAR